MSGQRLAFVDFRLDNFHANVYLEAIRGPLAARGWTVSGCQALDEAEGRAWAKKHDVPYCADAAALGAAADAFAVLAPSNPETHLDLCRRVFPLGKPTYVDKTFAPDLAVAREIFALADRHGVAVQTSSALRYTNVQAAAAELGGAQAIRSLVAWGGGSSFGEYAIHPVEMTVSCLGPDAVRLLRRGDEKDSQLLIDFSGGRTAVVNVSVDSETDFAAALTTAAATRYVAVNGDTLFTDMAAGILDFLEAGRPLIDRRESLAIRRILDAAGDPQARAGFVDLPAA